MKKSCHCAIYIAFMSTLLVIATNSVAAAESERGAELYQQRCAACHDNPQDYVPPRETLRYRSADYVVQSLTEGAMKIQTEGLSAADIEALAIHVTGKNLGESTVGDNWSINFCSDKPQPITAEQFYWNGWGRDLENSRYQPNPGFNVVDVPKLKLKWAFAYPTGRTNSQPTVVGDRVYIASAPGLVYALDAATGCTDWAYKADTGTRATIVVGPIPNSSPTRYAVYIGTTDRGVHAVDADTGKLLWRTEIADIPAARITGSPLLYDDKVIVPMSSLEEGSARGSKYGCCQFRGSVAVLDAASGKILWRTYVIDKTPAPFKVNKNGVQMYGPAGAAIWSSPTIDANNQRIFAATGDSYTDVDEEGSDAIVSFSLSSGAILWRNQVTDLDNFVVGCSSERGHANCPEPLGPDFDFGSSPILRTFSSHGETGNGQSSGKQLLLVGQKSGIIYALDPNADGKIVWQKQLGAGSPLGGIQWGSAADAATVYVPVSDILAPTEQRKPGLWALDIATGEERWFTPAPRANCAEGATARSCSNALSAAVSAIPGAVFAGSVDGHLRAYSTANGAIIWQIDTGALNMDSVNSIPVKGGQINATGPVIANGTVFVNAGYGSTPGQPGNVLLAFTVDGK